MVILVSVLILILVFMIVVEAIIIFQLGRLYKRQLVKSELLSDIIERFDKNGKNIDTGNFIGCSSGNKEDF
ncbi:hypothetical protein JCM31739_10690 [Faecalimonas canis]